MKIFTINHLIKFLTSCLCCTLLLTITNSYSQSWSVVGTSITGKPEGNFHIKTNVAGVPHIVYQNGSDDAVYVKKLTANNTWENIGGDASDDNSSFGFPFVDIVFNSTTPYVLYSIFDGARRIGVSKLGENDWESIINNRPEYDGYGANLLAISPNSNILYLKYGNDEMQHVQKLENGSWTAVANAIPSYSSESIVISSNGTPYLSYYTEEGIKVVKAENGNWVDLSNSTDNPGYATGANGGGGYLAFSPDESVMYLLYLDDNNFVRVNKREANSNNWTSFGGIVSIETNDESYYHDKMQLLVDKNGIIYVAYHLESGETRIKAHHPDSNTGSWLDLGNFATTNGNNIDPVNLTLNYFFGGIAINNTSEELYVSFYDQASNTIKVHKHALISANTLPVTLTNYNAKAQTNGTVLINWKTSSKHHADYFTVQRSTDGKAFRDLQNIPAKSTTGAEYSFTDGNPFNGKSYYRLKLKNKNGSEEVLGTEAVTVSLAENDLQVYANPLNGNTFTIQVGANLNNQIAVVQLIDLSGKVIFKNEIPVSNGKIQVSLDKKPTAGTYLVKVADYPGIKLLVN